MRSRGFYAVCIDDNTKPKRSRRDRMRCTYRCVVNGGEVDEYSWISFFEMLEHPDEEQYCRLPVRAAGDTPRRSRR
jgi:hypothetical protein